MPRNIPAKPKIPSKLPRLTPRELLVLRLVGEGYTTDEIAAILCRERSTIKQHLENIHHKLETSRRTVLVLTAIRFGLVTV